MDSIEIICDFHIHSNFSDGYSAPENIIKHAIEKNIRKICFTDHYSYLKPALVEEDLKIYFNSLEEIKGSVSSEIEIFIGIEVDQSSISSFEELSRYSWDLVLFEYTFNLPDWKKNFRETIKFKHSFPDLNVGLAHTRFTRVTNSEFEQVMKNISENDIIIELNTGYQNYLDTWFRYLDDRFLYSIGSDAHSTIRLGQIDGALNFLNRQGIPFSQIIKL
jgi:histidinol phosphatase-like PHP family hydrolase